MPCADLALFVLQFFKWLETGKCIEFTEKDYASLLDCIAKVNGLRRAEKFVDEIPDYFRGRLVHQTLLENSAIFFES